MTKHDLHHEFPELNEKIHELKVSNAHFRKLFDEYDEINTSIYRMESGIEPVSDDVLKSERLKRVHLKDTLYQLLLNKN